MQAEVLKKWFHEWALGRSNEIDAIVCFGSHGRGDANHSSDLDICVVGNAILHELKNFIDVEKHLFSTSICYLREDRNKLFAIVTASSGDVVRIDCFVVDQIEEVAKYIVGSEMTINCINNIFTYRHPTRGNSCERWIRSKISNVEPMNGLVLLEFIGSLIKDFIESFEVASNKRASGDKFQFLVQLQLSHKSLVRLEFIRQGGRKFLYLPKMAFVAFDATYTSADGLSMRRHFEDVLEPRGKLNEGHTLQNKYLQQFRSTLLGLSGSLGANVLMGIADNVDVLCAALLKILDRDRFYNLRDAAVGGMVSNKVFRSGFFEIEDICKQYEIRTVFDLRNDDEVRKRPTNLPANITVIAVHIIAQSPAGSSFVLLATNTDT